jgi:hypothetical protein
MGPLVVSVWELGNGGVLVCSVSMLDKGLTLVAWKISVEKVFCVLPLTRASKAPECDVLLDSVLILH